MKTIKFFILSILLVFITDSLILGQNAEQILETNKPALVSIWNFEEASFNYNSEMYSFDTAVLWGSGFIVNDKGLVGTCYHVVSQLDSILIKTSEGKFYPASIVSVDTANDLALLKITNDR
jgi:S1-C subfamily serine protease